MSILAQIERCGFFWRYSRIRCILFFNSSSFLFLDVNLLFLRSWQRQWGWFLCKVTRKKRDRQKMRLFHNRVCITNILARYEMAIFSRCTNNFLNLLLSLQICKLWKSDLHKKISHRKIYHMNNKKILEKITKHNNFKPSE